MCEVGVTGTLPRALQDTFNRLQAPLLSSVLFCFNKPTLETVFRGQLSGHQSHFGHKYKKLQVSGSLGSSGEARS